MNRPTETPSATEDNIAGALNACDDHIRSHRKSARFTLVVLVLILSGLMTILFGIAYTGSTSSSYEFSTSKQTVSRETLDAVLKARTDRITVTNYIVLALWVLVFGVLMSVYRFHLNEVSKAEQYKMGFIRILIAAHSSAKGYETEVRRSLADGAFEYAKPSFGLSSGKRLESPLPGHPTTDIATVVLNKVLDQIEIRAEAKHKYRKDEDAP